MWNPRQGNKEETDRGQRWGVAKGAKKGKRLVKEQVEVTWGQGQQAGDGLWELGSAGGRDRREQAGDMGTTVIKE